MCTVVFCYTMVPSYKANHSVMVMKKWPNKKGGLFCEENLLIFYYLSVSGRWPDKRGGLWWPGVAL